jgi:CubicO group peptidase (beta-lactamase class C family)
VQLAVEDVTGRPFAEIARERVFEPLGLEHSTFEQPLPAARRANAAAGHDDHGVRIAGGFHVHPEQMAAGLWTTPSDLAVIMIELQRGWRGESERVLPSALVRDMLTPVEGGDYGLGMGVDQRAGTSEAYFQHGGSNLGFKCRFFAHREAGYGVVIMTNGEHGAALGQEVFNAVAHADGWAGFSFAEVPALAESAEEARAAAGRYALPGPGTLELREADGHLLARHYPGPEHPLLRVAMETWLDPETGRRFAIERGEGGLVEAL